MINKAKVSEQNLLANPSYQNDEILARQCSIGLEPQHSEWRAGKLPQVQGQTQLQSKVPKTKQTQKNSCYLSQHRWIWRAQCDLTWGPNEAAHRTWGHGDHQGREEMGRCWSGTTFQWDERRKFWVPPCSRRHNQWQCTPETATNVDTSCHPPKLWGDGSAC